MNELVKQYSQNVRYACLDDLDKVIEIERLSFPNPWQYHEFKSSLKEIFILYEEDTILGFLITVCCYKNIRADIMKVAVHPDHRCEGIATILIKTVLEILDEKDIKEVALDVDVVRKGAIRLYKKFGFEITTIVPGTFEDEDVESFCIMKLDLADYHSS